VSHARVIDLILVVLLFSLVLGLLTLLLCSVTEAVLVLLALMSLLFLEIVYLTFSRRRKRIPDDVHARLIAMHWLDIMRTHSGFSGLRIANPYVQYDVSSMSSTLREFKLVSEDGKNKGYVLVNLDRTDFPVPEFSDEGPCVTEQLHRIVGHSNFRVIRWGPMYSEAVDESGAILASVGCRPIINPPNHELKNSKVSESEYRNLFLEDLMKFRKRRLNEVAEAWHHFPGGEGSASDLMESVLPQGVYSYGFEVEGADRQPVLNQIEVGEGANSGSDCKIGCGCVAWGTLIAWHDLLWSPLLLFGSQSCNGVARGNPEEPKWNTYVDRILVRLGESTYLDNHNCFWTSGNGGMVHDWNMKKGKNFVEEVLSHWCEGFSEGEEGEDIYNRIVYQFLSADNRPVIVKVPSHFCVAFGYYHVDIVPGLWSVDYLAINTGWGYSPKKYIDIHYVEKYWYVKNIPLSREYVFPGLISSSGPSLATVWSGKEGEDGNPYCDDMRLFFVDRESGTIKVFYLTRSGDFIHLDQPAIGPVVDAPQSGEGLFLRTEDLPIQFPPSVSYDGYGLYVAYADKERRIHVLYANKSPSPGKLQGSWKDLNFPANLRTEVAPVIATRQFGERSAYGHWITVGFVDEENGAQLISTNKDIGRSAQLWPDQPGYSGTDGYWRIVDLNVTQKGLSIIRFGDFIYLYYESRIPSPGSGDMFYICKPDGTDGRWLSSPRRFVTPPSLLVSNKTLFMAYRTSGDRWEDQISVESLYAYRQVIPDINSADPSAQMTRWLLSATEVARLKKSSIGNPCLGRIDLESGKNPVLVASWTDPSGDIHVCLMSVDTSTNMLDYTGRPR
jgi:hypothetical protein